MAAQRLGPTDQAGQQDWLRSLLARLDRAEAQVLAPDEAARRIAQRAVLLRESAQGRPVPSAQLAELVHETDQREKEAIDRLARQFRIQVYQTFRQQRGTFTRRRAAWSRVLASWESAGSRFEDQGRLIDWLQLALQTSMPSSIGPLPQDPAFRLAPAAAPAAALAEVAPRPVQGPPLAIPPPVPPIDSAARRGASEPGQPPQPRGTSGEPAAPAPLARPAVARALDMGEVMPRAAMPGARAERFVARRPIEPPSTLPEPAGTVTAAPMEIATTSTPVRVNLDELSARIAGANLAMKALEQELAKPRLWGARQLGPLVDQLDTLVARQKDLKIVRDLVSPDEQTRVGQLDSPRAVISQLAARIAEARANDTTLESSEVPAERRAELDHLDALSRRLAELATQD